MDWDFNQAQLDLITEVNGLIHKKKEKTQTDQDRARIVHLIQTLVSISSFPLDSIDGSLNKNTGKGILHLSNNTYFRLKKRYGTPKVSKSDDDDDDDDDEWRRWS